MMVFVQTAPLLLQGILAEAVAETRPLQRKVEVAALEAPLAKAKVKAKANHPYTHG